MKVTIRVPLRLPQEALSRASGATLAAFARRSRPPISRYALRMFDRAGPLRPHMRCFVTAKSFDMASALRRGDALHIVQALRWG